MPTLFTPPDIPPHEALQVQAIPHCSLHIYLKHTSWLKVHEVDSDVVAVEAGEVLDEVERKTRRRSGACTSTSFMALQLLPIPRCPCCVGS